MDRAAAPLLLWFRRDLRLGDNRALSRAVATGSPIVPVFVWDEAGEGDWAPGGAGRVYLHRALGALRSSLRARGLDLVCRRGPAGEELERLLAETGARGVYWNRLYEPAVIARDRGIKERLRAAGHEAESFNSALLFEPHEIATQAGHPFQVFTPFWRSASRRPVDAPEEDPGGALRPPAGGLPPGPLEELGLWPDHPWAERVAGHWAIGEEAARGQLARFVAEGADAYATDRDLPATDGTSRLSPALHWGTIGPREVWATVERTGRAGEEGPRTFLAEIGWREFAHHVLFHFPRTPEEPLREKFADFPWEDDAGARQAWRAGRTGYPIVDAGMRQLYEEGWMHNRVRMIVGSLLVKHLLQPWQAGARWFWDCLVDADLAANTLGWQWSGGCGADAAPYFRVFNPMTQGKKFDPAGRYVRRYVPELEELPDAYVHEPWEAPETVLGQAGLRLGRDYPRPIIDHRTGRQRALAAFAEVKG